MTRGGLAFRVVPPRWLGAMLFIAVFAWTTPASAERFDARTFAGFASRPGHQDPHLSYDDLDDMEVVGAIGVGIGVIGAAGTAISGMLLAINGDDPSLDDAIGPLAGVCGLGIALAVIAYTELFSRAVPSRSFALGPTGLTLAF